MPPVRIHPILPSLEALEHLTKCCPEVDPAAVHTSLLLLQVASRLGARLDEEFARFGLSQGRFVVLMLLVRNPQGMSPAALAEAAGVRRPTISGLLESLERDGLAERAGDPDDHRACVITHTARADALLQRILPNIYRMHASTMSTLSVADRCHLSTLLHRVREQLVPGGTS